MKLRFICAQPTSLYYAWQVEVMINNFIEMGINPNMIDIVCWKINNVIPEEWARSYSLSRLRHCVYKENRLGAVPTR